MISPVLKSESGIHRLSTWASKVILQSVARQRFEHFRQEIGRSVVSHKPIASSLRSWISASHSTTPFFSSRAEETIMTSTAAAQAECETRESKGR